MRQLVVIMHDIRSTYNVGSLLRTAECLGVAHVYLTGYTPYPTAPDDERLPHIRDKVGRAIDKTALGAADLVSWSHGDSIAPVIQQLKHEGYTVVALEQTPQSIAMPQWIPASKTAIVLGREVEGIASSVLELCDFAVEIPQFGKKESLNVTQAAAICLYHVRFSGNQ